MQQLFMDSGGRARGVKVREGYSFSDENSGTPKKIGVNQAVVLATGGFANDIPFRSAQALRLDETVDTTTVKILIIQKIKKT